MPVPKKILETIKKIITSINKLFTLNIGTIIFGILFIYLLVCIGIYLTSDHVTSYQVVSGPLTKNQTYTGIALRSEEVVTASSPGYITYYAREGSKVRKMGSVYAIGDTKADKGEVAVSDEDLSRMRSQMAKFAYNFDPDTFYRTYGFKYELEGSVLQSAGITGEGTTITLGSQTIYSSPGDGVVVYSTDGYEERAADSITAGDFNQMSYQKEELITDDKVDAGSPVYKLITSEKWSLVIPLTDKQAASLVKKDRIRVRFKKDGSSQVGKFTILEQDGQKFGQLDFNNGMVRYAADRFIDIELVTNSEIGLKIPMSSVVKNECYVIPDKFMGKDEEKKSSGFFKQTVNKKGEKVVQFVSTTIYDHDEEKELYYVDKSDFKEGDVILNKETQERYTIKETKTFEGVYSMNKGYAVFRKIVISDKNEEYCIVNADTSYGIAQFDHIVLDGKSIKSEDILY